MSNKTRLDVLLVERGLEQTRQRAQAMIMSGLVFVDGQRVDKAGTAIPNDAQVEVRGNTLRYVSRGGLKLEKAMTTFGLRLDGCICADIGASTGGFTDCMLQNGATKVYAVDVGYGQLDWKLRSDERVVCMERTNARYLDHEQISDELDLPASMCRSFPSSSFCPRCTVCSKRAGMLPASSSPSLKRGAKRWGRRASSATRTYTLRCWKISWIMQRILALQCLILRFLPFAGLRGISNTSAILKAAIG